MMFDLSKAQVGDKVAVLTKSRHRATHPGYLTKITKITAKRIYTGNDKFWDLDGKPLFNRSHDWTVTGVTVGISNNPDDIKVLTDAAATRIAEHDRIESERQARENRKTWQLATSITSTWSGDPVADLELLGEEYLERLVDDIRAAKAAARIKQMTAAESVK